MITFITGGTRSGKSSYGEQLLESEKKVLYLATAKITDDEMARRVEHHKNRRGQRYTTVEGYRQMDASIEAAECDSSILDCVGTTITNWMFDQYSDWDNITEEQVEAMEKELLLYFKEIIKAMKKKSGRQVIISNEVGMALVSEYRLGRVFTDVLGRVNQFLASQADEVILMVSGIPMYIRKKS